MKNLVDIYFSNPLKTWWKARKYFKCPKIELHFFSDIIYNCPFASYKYVSKILTIFSSDVQWKDKWNSPRHERDPFIWICFFKKFGFSINFKVYSYSETGKLEDVGMHYWEYLLDYLYYRKDINKFSIWTHNSKISPDCREYYHTHLFSLNKRGLIKFNEKFK